MSCFTLVAPRRSEDTSALTLDSRTQPHLVGPNAWTTKREMAAMFINGVKLPDVLCQACLVEMGRLAGCHKAVRYVGRRLQNRCSRFG